MSIAKISLSFLHPSESSAFRSIPPGLDIDYDSPEGDGMSLLQATIAERKSTHALVAWFTDQLPAITAALESMADGFSNVEIEFVVISPSWCKNISISAEIVKLCANFGAKISLQHMLSSD